MIRQNFMKAIIPVFLSLSLPSCAVMTLPAVSQVHTADKLFKEKRYSDAIALYKKTIHNYPDSPGTADARYGLALTLAFYDNPQKDYTQAAQEFDEFVRLYPDHDYAPEARNWSQVLKTIDRLNKNIQDLKQLDIKHEEKRQMR